MTAEDARHLVEQRLGVLAAPARTGLPETKRRLTVYDQGEAFFIATDLIFTFRVDKKTGRVELG